MKTQTHALSTHRHWLANKFNRTLLVLSLALAFSLSGFAQQPGNPAKERIGVYDSRAVAIGYAGSPFQLEKMRIRKAQLDQAQKAGDTKAVTRLKAEGQAWQTTLHQQGFGTAPVDDILNHVSGELPKIQKDAGVTRLVSKWNKPELKRYPGADRIDVTMMLVDAFRPSETQRTRAIEIQQKPPVKVRE